MYKGWVQFRSYKFINCVNVIIAASPEAKVMQAACILIERYMLFVFGRFPDQNSCATANAIEGCVVVYQRFHLEKMTKLFPEGFTLFYVVDCHLYVGNAIDFYAHGLNSCFLGAMYTLCMTSSGVSSSIDGSDCS
jgi:hypothetical protein